MNEKIISLLRGIRTSLQIVVEPMDLLSRWMNGKNGYPPLWIRQKVGSLNDFEGSGCPACPSKDKEHCADALRNLAARFLNAIGTPSLLNALSKELERDYGMSQWAQLSLISGFIDLPA